MQTSQFNFTIQAEANLNNNINHNGVLTQTLHDCLVKRGETELINRVFWTNPSQLDFNNLYSRWEGDVYVYNIDNLVVLTSKDLELRINTRFWINNDALTTDFTSDAVIDSFVKMLSILSSYVTTPDESGVVRNGILLFGKHVPSKSITDSELSEPEQMTIVELPPAKVTPGHVARPTPSIDRIRDETKLPLRTPRGLRKSYAEIRAIMEDYVLEANDYVALPVMNADMLSYLKMEGGVYVDPLTEVQITYKGMYITVCTASFKIEFDATKRTGHKAIYGQMSSLDENHPKDLQEVANVLHALSNLYKKHK